MTTTATEETTMRTSNQPITGPVPDAVTQRILEQRRAAHRLAYGY